MFNGRAHERRTGWLADTKEEYAAAIVEVLTAHEKQPQKIAAVVLAARQSVTRFSDDEFSLLFKAAFTPLLLK